jgi:hypothetical protein
MFALLQFMHSTFDEVFDASPNDLQKLLKNEKDRNKDLANECKMLKFQVWKYYTG